MFINLSGKAGKNSKPAEKYAAVAHRSERRTPVVLNNKFEIFRCLFF
jgi:hypothetical protein